jgi:lipopolysaccharide export system permease protein
LPLIGVILGLNLGRTPRSGGIAIGILLLLSVQKILEYGLALAERGAVPAWAGFWPVVLVLAVAALFMFRRLAHGHILFGPGRVRRRWKSLPAKRVSDTTQI